MAGELDRPEPTGQHANRIGAGDGTPGRAEAEALRSARSIAQTGPLEPVAPAPARFGTAGISAGEDRRIKTTVPEDPHASADAMARGLGWFSIALGVTELVAARPIAEWLGMDEKSTLIRLYGAREIGQGIGILAASNPEARAPWMWARVAGDALDLASLAPGLDGHNPRRDRVAGAMIAIGAVAALDAVCASMLSGKGHGARG